MASSADVRAWAASQEPPLAKLGIVGRLPKAAVEAFNAAHPDDTYEGTGRVRVLPAGPPVDAPASGVTDATATHDGTVENPSSVAPTGNVTSMLNRAADFSDGSNYDSDGHEERMAKVYEFNAEKYVDAP